MTGKQSFGETKSVSGEFATDVANVMQSCGRLATDVANAKTAVEHIVAYNKFLFLEKNLISCLLFIVAYFLIHYPN